MNQYRIYAKRIQNNAANEPEYIGLYEGYNKQNAIANAMKDHSNAGIYQLNSYFAICQVWKFEEVQK